MYPVIIASQSETQGVNYQERYETIVNSEWFKKAYDGKSLGDIVSIQSSQPVQVTEEECAHPTATYVVKKEHWICDGCKMVVANKAHPRSC